MKRNTTAEKPPSDRMGAWIGWRVLGNKQSKAIQRGESAHNERWRLDDREEKCEQDKKTN